MVLRIMVYAKEARKVELSNTPLSREQYLGVKGEAWVCL